MTIKMFSMFTGIGGFELAAKLINKDIELIGYSEIDKYAIEVFNKHFPGVKNYGDATRIDTRELPDGFDLLVGGFPCQSFSVAGKRAGFADKTRGTLFFDIARILTDKRPTNFLLENVKGLLSHDSGKTFQTMLGILTSMGYRVEWQVLNSKNYGVPQNRERIFIVGHLATKSGSRRKVFPFTSSHTENGIKRLGHSGSGGQKGDILGVDGLSSSLTATDYKQPKQIQVGSVANGDAGRVFDPSGTSCTLKSEGGGWGAKTGLYTIAPLTERRTEEAKKVRKKAREEGKDYSPRRMKELVEREDDLSNTVTSAQSKEQLLKVKPKILDASHRNEGIRVYEDIAPTLNSRDYKEPRCVFTPLQPDQVGRTVRKGGRDSMTNKHNWNVVEPEPTRIRRLTPTECERLQGFPDGWTEGLSDTQRYKTLGNAITVNVVAEILKALYKEQTK